MSLKRLVGLVLIGIGASLLLRRFVVEGIYIASGSMEPTLPIRAHIWLDKMTYRLRAPRRGEMIIFRSPVGEREMAKRVIAIPGDALEIRNKKVYLNQEELQEPYVKHTRPGDNLAGDNIGPITVPRDAVFVLGDNRDESSDSSVWKDPETGEPVYFVPYSFIRGILRGFY